MGVSADRYLAEALAGYGVTHFFHVPVIVPSAMREMMRLGATLPVMTHGEKAAAYMADGYARVSGRPGLCGSQGIGATNLAAGLRDACLARIPVIALTGGKRAETEYRRPYQEIDDMPIFDALTKFNATVALPERLPDLLATAFRAATTGMPSPVHLELGGTEGEVATTGEIEVGLVSDTRFGRYPAIRHSAPTEDVISAVQALQAAARPVCVAGGGVPASGAGAALRELAQRLSMPVATSLNAKGILQDDDPLALGVVGEYSSEAANRLVSEADLVFYVGSQTGGLVTRNWTVPPNTTRVLHLDIEPENIGRNYPYTVGICGDARSVLSQLLEATAAVKCVRQSWLARVAEVKRDWARRVTSDEASESVPIAPQRLCRELSDALPSNAIVATDTGHAAAWLAQNIHSTTPTQTFVRAHGSLGWSLPASIGAKCAAPDRAVICLTCDGGFYYHLAELETALRYDLNVVVVVNNNASLSQERSYWDESDSWDRNWRMRDTNFAAAAEAFGCIGIRVERPSDLRSALAAALDADLPAVIDVRTDDTSMAIPSWSP